MRLSDEQLANLYNECRHGKDGTWIYGSGVVFPLITELMEAREVVKPFAEAAQDIEDTDEDRWEIWERPEAMNITVGDLRRARNFLNKETDG